jgi:hypothetical protein
VVSSLNYLEATELEDIQARNSDLRDFLEGVAVGIAIASLFLGC